MKAKIAKARVGNQKINCNLVQGFQGQSMCTDKILKQVGGKLLNK
jgi:hypothetical protein